MSFEFSQRRFRRYEVSAYRKLRLKLVSKNSSKVQLLNLSLGGCCFLEKSSKESYSSRESLRIHLENSQRSWRISCRVVYVQPLFLGNERCTLYGVEFDLSDRDQLAGLMEKLDELSATGRVRLL